MLNLYIGYCQKLYTQHCHFLYIVNLLVTAISIKSFILLPSEDIASSFMAAMSLKSNSLIPPLVIMGSVW